MRTHAEPAHRLRSHLVRRLPSPADLARRKHLDLTARDKDILVAVHTHGVLTTDLIELAFFPAGEAGRTTHCSRAYERLRRLWLWQMLERIELPVARALGGRRAYLYTLGPRAAHAVGALLGEGAEPVRRRRLDRIDDVFVEHDLKAAAFWANLRALPRQSALRGLRWVSERELRARNLRVMDPERVNRWLPFLPDGYVELVYADGDVQPLLVEVDMGTLTLGRFRAKVRAFEAFRAQGLFERHFGRGFFEVAVLTTTERRLEHLRRVAQRELYQERWSDYQFATLEVLDPARFADADWLTAAGERQGLLYDKAWDSPRATRRSHEPTPGSSAATRPAAGTQPTPTGGVYVVTRASAAT